MGNRVCKFVVFLYVYIPVNMFVVPLGENPGDATALYLHVTASKGRLPVAIFSNKMINKNKRFNSVKHNLGQT